MDCHQSLCTCAAARKHQHAFRRHARKRRRWSLADSADAPSATASPSATRLSTPGARNTGGNRRFRLRTTLLQPQRFADDPSTTLRAVFRIGMACAENATLTSSLQLTSDTTRLAVIFSRPHAAALAPLDLASDSGLAAPPNCRHGRWRRVRSTRVTIARASAFRERRMSWILGGMFI